MLSDLEKHEIDEEIPKFEYPQAACIEALLIIQKHRGYVSDEAIQDIASYLSMPIAELDSVATFYNLIYRKPVGKNVIRICDSISCHILEYQKVLNSLKEYLKIDYGQTTPDGQYTLLPAQCLGCCDKGPAMMINGELYTHLDQENVMKILKK